jgi:hypothetical protein
MMLAGLLAYALPACLPIHQLMDSGRGTGEFTVAVTATGIAPDCHRTSLLIRAMNRRFVVEGQTSDLSGKLVTFSKDLFSGH